RKAALWASVLSGQDGRELRRKLTGESEEQRQPAENVPACRKKPQEFPHILLAWVMADRLRVVSDDLERGSGWLPPQ
ncbi:MAG: hypothetical protein WB608_03465, partial [Terracidiphilus sp.]